MTVSSDYAHDLMMKAHPGYNVGDASFLEFKQNTVVCLKPSDDGRRERERFTEAHGLLFLDAVPVSYIFNGYNNKLGIMTEGDQRGMYDKPTVEGFYLSKGKSVSKEVQAASLKMVSLILVHNKCCHVYPVLVGIQKCMFKGCMYLNSLCRWMTLQRRMRSRTRTYLAGFFQKPL